MPAQQPVKAVTSRIPSVVPAIWGWGTDRGAFGNLLLLSLVAAAGEWVVHQLVYAIEYGSQFAVVMRTTPHRLYMAPLGVGFAVLAAVGLVLSSLAVLHGSQKSARLIRLLPPRVRARVPAAPHSVPLVSLAGAAALLATYQSLLYIAQENAEAIAQGYGWQGISVLMSTAHPVVIPVHLLVALCGSLLLWTIVSWVRASRRNVRIAEALARLLTPRFTAPSTCRITQGRVPNLRLPAGSLSLRSPPLAV